MKPTAKTTNKSKYLFEYFLLLSDIVANDHQIVPIIAVIFFHFFRMGLYEDSYFSRKKMLVKNKIRGTYTEEKTPPPHTHTHTLTHYP